MPSTTSLEEEETVDAPGNDGNASMPEQVKRRNPWRKDDDDINFCYMLIIKRNSKSQFILYQMVVISDQYGYKLNPPNFSFVSTKFKDQDI